MSRSALMWPVPVVLGLCAFILAQPPSPGPRPLLGVAVTPADDNGEGVQVREVLSDSPAAKAGFKDGDVITKVNGKAVTDVTEFLRAVGSKKPGDKLAVEVRRDGKDMTLKATLGNADAGGAPPVQLPEVKELGRPAFLGVQVEDLTPELRKQLNVKTQAGAVVEEVVPNSPAAKAGLQRDDVIVAANGQTVSNPVDLRAAVQKAGAGKEIALRYERGGEMKTAKATLKGGGVPGGIVPSGEFGKMPFDIESFWDQSGKMRKLEQRVDMLEKRVRELEKQVAGQKK